MRPARQSHRAHAPPAPRARRFPAGRPASDGPACPPAYRLPAAAPTDGRARAVRPTDMDGGVGGAGRRGAARRAAPGDRADTPSGDRGRQRDD
ncbi:hypothetical protein GCM10010124_10060 [Pilimelia terevasa]|uniref:Uncharacterized protein n=1 Tax=Pilimelia terevasa TaxID=53372 RepID=A0A8J3BMA2_9ACTN|nr:hypothetical protein GCM10010124_10060 [Pilimelia terevasa]